MRKVRWLEKSYGEESLSQFSRSVICSLIDSKNSAVEMAYEKGSRDSVRSLV